MRVYFKVFPVNWESFPECHIVGINRLKESGFLENENQYPFAFKRDCGYYLIIVASFEKFKNKFSAVRFNKRRPFLVEEDSFLFDLEELEDFSGNKIYCFPERYPPHEISKTFKTIADFIEIKLLMEKD